MISSAIKYKPHRVEGGIEFVKVSDYDESNIVWSSLSQEDDLPEYLDGILENFDLFHQNIIRYKVSTQCSWVELSKWVLNKYNIKMSEYKLKKSCRQIISYHQSFEEMNV